MNMFVPMKQGGGSDKDFLERLAKHFQMHYRNADNIIEKLKEISGKSVTKKPTSKSKTYYANEVESKK